MDVWASYRYWENSDNVKIRKPRREYRLYAIKAFIGQKIIK